MVRTRRTYRRLLEELYASGGGDPAMRRRYLRQQMRAVSDRLRVAVARRVDALDALFASLDASMASSRAVADQAMRTALDKRAERRRRQRRRMGEEEGGGERGGEEEEEGGGGEEELLEAVGEGGEARREWEGTLGRAVERGSKDCPICLMPLLSGTKRVVLLSCTHWFHAPCLRALEQFVGPMGRRRCPVCRAEGYEKRLVDPAALQRVKDLDDGRRRVEMVMDVGGDGTGGT